jgi:uncharacterized phiE125 gp8 family phage protein
MTSLLLQTAPVNQIVTLSEVKTHLRVDGNDEDSLISNLIDAATSYLDGPDGVLGRAMITQTWDWSIDYFPAMDSDLLLFPLGDVQNVTSITYTDTDGVSQTWDSANYNIDKGSTPARLFLSHNVSWPTTQDVENAITIRFVAGFGDNASDVPAAIRQAAMLLIGTMYCNRETARGMRVYEVPFAAKHLIAPFKKVRY